ncbi:uncharacterized protein LOC6620417 [Drosophila sechellia]|nr:uncharacterized protein LOC6620417 [Drosophila sechellia]XP_032573582.1 uncharacterized protein LOC6620417 [Drosophila sechellia]XP_032573583.1 uncharacterized protein LOC6620417 [Drosophila sechellia]XP_032573584.1 uncharacterized protein LOC6620417 [Drosophila sechellia]XP_032573585.1 uncharacterized protein LOC6620417 [Drosophila sechellia]
MTVGVNKNNRVVRETGIKEQPRSLFLHSRSWNPPLRSFSLVRAENPKEISDVELSDEEPAEKPPEANEVVTLSSVSAEGERDGHPGDVVRGGRGRTSGEGQDGQLQRATSDARTGWGMRGNKPEVEQANVEQTGAHYRDGWPQWQWQKDVAERTVEGGAGGGVADPSGRGGREPESVRTLYQVAIHRRPTVPPQDAAGGAPRVLRAE